MSEEKTYRPRTRLPRGFRDRGACEIAAERRALDIIRGVYESYGFEALETPSFEYTDALGKFLPDQDRPNEGVFSLKDDDEQWLSLRYDLTAPLARYVAENFQDLPKPFRRYQAGTVWRNEKPGPGRYREFTQFDADTVGTSSPAADAELLMLLCDTLEALGLKRGEYVVKLNSRKLLGGLLEKISLDGQIDAGRCLTILKAIDKFDRFGPDGVFQLLTTGREDKSGDVTKGASLTQAQADNVMRFLGYSAKVLGAHQTTYIRDQLFDLGDTNLPRLERLGELVAWGDKGEEGRKELEQIIRVVEVAGFEGGRIQFDQTVVRGLDYYTGPVFEAQLTFPTKNEAGETVMMGSVAGGGRYDNLVARFTGQSVPATGVSIGVSRLLGALRARGLEKTETPPLIIVLVLGKEDVAASFAIARELRNAGLRAEAYVGEGGMKAQLKYADKRGAAIAVIEGGDERGRGEVTLKDLALGAELAKATESRAAWVKDRPAQISVPRKNLVAELRKLLADRG